MMLEHLSNNAVIGCAFINNTCTTIINNQFLLPDYTFLLYSRNFDEYVIFHEYQLVHLYQVFQLFFLAVLQQQLTVADTSERRICCMSKIRNLCISSTYFTFQTYLSKIRMLQCLPLAMPMINILASLHIMGGYTERLYLFFFPGASSSLTPCMLYQLYDILEHKHFLSKILLLPVPLDAIGFPCILNFKILFRYHYH